LVLRPSRRGVGPLSAQFTEAANQRQVLARLGLEAGDGAPRSG
jgi:hypothetical protein